MYKIDTPPDRIRVKNTDFGLFLGYFDRFRVKNDITCNHNLVAIFIFKSGQLARKSGQ